VKYIYLLGCYKRVHIALEMIKANYEGKTGNEETLEQIMRGDKDIEAQAEAMEAEIGKQLFVLKMQVKW